MAMTSPPNGGADLTGKGGRKTASACDFVFASVMVDVGARTARAQNSAIAIVAGLILGLILVFIWLVLRLIYLFLRKSLPRVAKKSFGLSFFEKLAT
jgi:tetrahydromethanopterin S-methyltransferase subunit G